MGLPEGQPRLVLASASPRRRQLLEQLGLAFTVDPADLDESVEEGESPRGYVDRVSRAKAAAVARRHPGAVVLAADTTVVVGKKILGKPAHADEARQMLELLSGRSHKVLTGVALAGLHEGHRVVETRVEFRILTAAQIDWYIKTGEPMDKAGGYALQGVGGALVTAIHGSHSNVIGLPLVETLALLERHGVAPPWGHR